MEFAIIRTDKKIPHLWKMESFHRVLPTDTGNFLLHYIIYPNGTVFVWVADNKEISFDDFHVAVPDKFGSLPALSTRLGETDSRGRFTALRLSKRLGVQAVVSWSIDQNDETSRLIENEILKDILQNRPHAPVLV